MRAVRFGAGRMLVKKSDSRANICSLAKHVTSAITDSSNVAEHAKTCAASRSQVLSAVRFGAGRMRK